MIHYFPEEYSFEEPHEFTDPFRYIPHPAVIEAARLVIKRIDGDKDMAARFSEGKMLGVLVCSSPLCYIAAFSGNIGGKGSVEGFVPPIFDLTDPEGEFRKRESEISSLNDRIEMELKSPELHTLKNRLTETERKRDEDISLLRQKMSESKKERDRIRACSPDASTLSYMIRKSQSEKAGLKRRKALWEERISGIRSDMEKASGRIEEMKKQRASMSEELQEWIFRQYIVHNVLGESSSVADIFAAEGTIPPGGTGECAAPKLLEYAWRNGLKPLAMGEFWYGKSPETAVRTHGHFYPSCTSKCGPLLKYMMKGLHVMGQDIQTEIPVIIHEDNGILAVDKPSGMPSVPGLDGRLSLLEWLQEHYEKTKIESVHRLDMDTSGIMIYARNPEAGANLRKQFEDHRIGKTYMARISVGLPFRAMKGAICLPLSPDYDERPRQKADFHQGKESITRYEVVNILPDGTADMLLHPVTGRTHQLRVHCAHTLGLGRPILGDMLYGAVSVSDKPDIGKPPRLHLHALSITLTHPGTGETVTFTSSNNCY